MTEPVARQRLREAREKATAEREAGKARCTIPCDPDCDAVCHSDHQAGHKKDHWPWDCPAADRYDWGSDFNNGMVKQLRDQRNQARTELTEMRLAVAEQHVARPTMYEGAVQVATAVLYEGTPSEATEQVVLAVLRFALPRHETQHADAWKAAHERAVHFELEAVKATERADRAEAELKQVREQLGEPETQWGHQVHADDGHCGDEVPQTDERAARHAVAYLNKHTLPADARAVLVQREVRIHEGPWRVVPACECPHDYQPDGRLVRDGVLALGCPVHDPDAGRGDA